MSKGHLPKINYIIMIMWFITLISEGNSSGIQLDFNNINRPETTRFLLSCLLLIDLNVKWQNEANGEFLNY